jgi:tRNA modification GTPase
MNLSFDTICAISTPVGIGGISIIRISGNDAVEILKNIFTPYLEDIQSHKVYYGFIKNNFTGETIDEVLSIIMLSPKTYTREDIVEIHCHGGYIASKEILELLIKNGARLAEPGEFTKRAFLNGRIDLTQAEAVISSINAKNSTAFKISLSQLSGKLKEKIEQLKTNLIDIISEIESLIDFEEYRDGVDLDRLVQNIEILKNEAKKLIASYSSAKNFFDGVKVVIAGMPNVGKSSLLNYFLNENRAITSSIPGTTRDTIEEELNFEGIRIRLIDTAGLREAKDDIEAEGVKRAYKKLDESDIIIYLFDLSKGLTEYDKFILEKYKHKKILLIGNKYDLAQNISNDFLSISIKKEINLDFFKEKLKIIILENNNFHFNDVFITNIRQYEAIKQFHSFLKNIDFKNQTIDMVNFELKEALNELGKLTGEVTSEDILDNIFQNFCIGK